MTIKPIDMQVNISQMHEVGKNEQVRSETIAEQQHLLDKESNEKSKLIKSKLEESKKGEKTAIKEDDSKNKREREKKGYYDPEKKEKVQKKELMKDDKIGRIIDVFK